MTRASRQLIFSAKGRSGRRNIDCVTKNEIFCYTTIFFYNIQLSDSGLQFKHTVYEAIQARFLSGLFFSDFVILARSIERVFFAFLSSCSREVGLSAYVGLSFRSLSHRRSHLI